MLQEMGVTVWAPAETPVPAAAHDVPARESAAPALAPPPARPLPSAAAAAVPPAVAPRQAPGPSASTETAAGPSAAPMAAPALRLHAPKVLYPSADPAQAPAELGAGWLIVAESLTPTEPLGGDAGRLLDNMLRAMQLHRHPRVHLAALERAAPSPAPAPEPASGPTDDIPAALAGMVATLRPALVLVLGHVAARAALGRTEPLGRLRAGPHQLAGCPAVVTYDPAFLLRSQETKAAAWADLCRALAIVRTSAA